MYLSRKLGNFDKNFVKTMFLLGITIRRQPSAIRQPKCQPKSIKWRLPEVISPKRNDFSTLFFFPLRKKIVLIVTHWFDIYFCYSKETKKKSLWSCCFHDFFYFSSEKMVHTIWRIFFYVLLKRKKRFPLLMLISRISCYFSKGKKCLCSRFFYFFSKKNWYVQISNDLTFIFTFFFTS